MKRAFSDGTAVLVTAAANRTLGVPVIEDGMFGFPLATTLSGSQYMLQVAPGEYLIATDGTNLSTPVAGDLVYCTSGNVLTKTASANRLVGVITRTTGGEGVPTGYLVMYMYPVHREAHIHSLAVVEEATLTVATATDLATIPTDCLAVLSIHGTVGSTETHFKVNSKSATTATGECSIDYVARTAHFYSTDDPTAVKVTYIKNVSI